MFKKLKLYLLMIENLDEILNKKDWYVLNEFKRLLSLFMVNFNIENQDIYLTGEIIWKWVYKINSNNYDFLIMNISFCS